MKDNELSEMDFSFTFFCIPYKKKSIGVEKIFNIRFLTDIHVLGHPEHDFNIFTKCLIVCVWHTFCGRVTGKTNERN